MKITKSKLKEMIREEIQKLNEGSFKRGYWVILSGRGGELTRDFTERKSGIKNLIIDLARGGQIDAGDTISIEKGKTELKEIIRKELLNVIREELKLVLERMSVEAEELKLFIDNDSRLYKQRYIPIIKNLSKKKKSGRYRSTLASKGFMYLVNDGAKKYVREYGGNVRDVFPRRIKQELAKEFAKEFEQMYKDQEFDFMK